MSGNPYLDQVRQNLPRILALFDSDRTGKSFGMGDRYFWAWGLIDFGNGTFQGAAHGMACLWRSGCWPYATSREAFVERLDSLFQAARALTRPNGSLEEAFPNEGSFCVTALVAFDLLCAIGYMSEGDVPAKKLAGWQAVVSPMIEYLVEADEKHALISNHLATAVAALARWHRLTGDSAAEAKGRRLLDRILRHQSGEGWFKEYEGADPGYQSLCTYYLADVHQVRPDWSLCEALRRSIRFLLNFAHPDGSFGGLYGSRCTRFYYPAGLEELAGQIPEAAVLADFMARSIAAQTVVTLAAMDEPNLIPMFNAYCRAASSVQRRAGMVSEGVVPALAGKKYRLNFKEAGLVIDSGPGHYTIISIHRGGVVYHFREGRLSLLDAGVVLRDAAGRLSSTQIYAAENEVRLDADELQVEAPVCPMPKQLPTPFQFMGLRLLCITLFRVSVLRELVKQALVRMLITRKKRLSVTNLRRIRLGEQLSVTDYLSPAGNYQRVANPGAFVAIHMASQGYWQQQDEAK